MNSIIQPDNVVHKTGTTSSDHDVDSQVLAQSLAHLRSLKSQFSCRDQDQSLSLGAFRVDAFKGWDNKGGSLAGTVLCTGKDVSASERNGYRLFLNGRWLFKPSLKDSHHEFPLDVEVFKLKAFGGRDILRIWSVTDA